MICPKCRTHHLRQKWVEDQILAVDVCPKCRGIWFDAAELDQALATEGPPLPIPRRAERVATCCPKCDKPLYAFLYPQTRVTLEACRRCHGLWLDAGEFQAIHKAREYLEQLDTTADDAEPTGVKKALLEFIDSAIDRLLE